MSIFSKFLFKRKLSRQLLYSFGITLLITGIIITYTTSYSVSLSLQDKIEGDLDAATETISDVTLNVLDNELNKVIQWSNLNDVKQTATDSTTLDPVNDLWSTYEGEKWGDDSDASGTGILPRDELTYNSNNNINSDLDNYFLSMLGEIPYAEIFFTDARGYVVSATGNTGDFAQADEGWWQSAKSDNIFISDFEFDESSSTWSISISVSIKSYNTTTTNGDFAGVLKAQYSFESLKSILSGIQVGANGFAMIVVEDGSIVVNLEKASTGQSSLVEYIGQNNTNFLTQDKDTKLEALIGENAYLFDSSPLDFIGSWNLKWHVISIMPLSEVSDLVQQPLYTSIITTIVSLIIMIIFSSYISSMIVKRIEAIKEGAERIVHGDLTTEVKITENAEDEIGSLEISINEMMKTLSTLIGTTSSQITILKDSTENLSATTEEMNATAEEVASTTQSMANGASQQVEMISLASEQLRMATNVVNDIVKEINDNTRFSSDIALQTNILALNAGIEASRAGDYGRGFAVVAENVRKLSDQSKEASERIQVVAQQISDTLQDIFNDALFQIDSVTSVAEETAASAEEVAAAAEEITASIEEISSLSNELAHQSEISAENISKFTKK